MFLSVAVLLHAKGQSANGFYESRLVLFLLLCLLFNLDDRTVNNTVVCDGAARN